MVGMWVQWLDGNKSLVMPKAVQYTPQSLVTPNHPCITICMVVHIGEARIFWGVHLFFLKKLITFFFSFIVVALHTQAKTDKLTTSLFSPSRPAKSH